MQIKFTNNYYQKKKRIQDLPVFYREMMFGKLKNDSVNFIKLFQQGIMMNDLELTPLKINTIKAKKRLGYKLPAHPLYGAGLDIDNKTYINMLRIRRIKDGWKVYASWAKHHKSRLSLRALLEIHEYGKTIQLKSGAIIRIPERPAFTKTLNRYAAIMAQGLRDKEAPDAIRRYVMTGKTDRIQKIIARQRLGRKYEKDS
jgi:hypothetical protein